MRVGTGVSRSAWRKGQIRRTEVADWSGGDLKITVCRTSKQIVLRQDGKEVSFPIHQWQTVEDTVLRAITPLAAANERTR